MKLRNTFQQILFVAAFLLTGGALQAQVYTGGNASVSFTNNNVYADVAPILGYRINKLNVGVSPVLAYQKPQNLDAIYSYGGRLFTQYTVWQGLFVHGELEALNVQDFVAGADAEGNFGRTWVVGLPVGAGYNQMLGDRISLQAMVLFNVLENDNYPYENPIIRGGINYSLLKSHFF